MTAPFEVTKTVFPVLEFLQWQRAGDLELRPYYQRGSVWTSKAKSLFIDSLLRGYSIPLIFLQYRTDDTTLKTVRQVVDGQQRLRTIIAYIDSTALHDANESDNFQIMRSHNKEFAGKSFAELPKAARNLLINTKLSVHILPDDLPDPMLLQTFARLNSTGTRLNDQELRNAEYAGAFKSLAYDIAYEHLSLWLSAKLFTRQAIAQMREVEFVSELMQLLLSGVQAKSKNTIDNAYKRFDDDFTHSSEVEARARLILGHLEDLYKPDRTGRTLGPLHGQGWAYAICAILQESMLQDTLEEPKRNDQWLAEGTSIAQIRSGLSSARSVLEGEDDGIELPEDLIRAVRGASTDRRSRETRTEFLRTFIR